MLLRDPFPPSLLFVDLHLSFGQLLFPAQKGLCSGLPPPFPAIVMLKSPGHVSAKN